MNPIFAIFVLTQILLFAKPGESVLETVLIAEATKLGAPFAKTGLDRIHNEIFGSGRAARSTDVIIHNTSDETFQYVTSSTDSGVFSSSMLPPHEIPAKSSVVYGCESNGFLTGATECRVEYVSNTGRFIWMSTSNAYVGSAHSHAIDGVSVIHGGGNNNVVKFIITNPLPKYNNNGPAYTHEDSDDINNNDDSKDNDVEIATDVPQRLPNEDDATNEIVEIVSIDSQPVKATSGCNSVVHNFSTLLTTFSLLLCLHFHSRFHF